jgi:hypothetical protein
LHAVPNWSLWRWVARALGQVFACLADRFARPAGGGADVGDRRRQGVLPGVVGLPPGDLIKQVRFGPAMEGCCGQHCVLELRVLLAAARSVTARVFTREEQAHNHVQVGNIALSVQVMLDWLDSIGRRDGQLGLTSWTWSTGK